MKRIRRVSVVLAIAALVTASVGAAAGDDWPGWRGPNRNAIADEGNHPPTSWSETANIVWSAEVPGRGHSSPIVVGNLVLLTTADDEEQIQFVLAFDRATGTPRWKTEVSRGNFPSQIHDKNTHATPTLTSNGERVFAVFHNNNAVELTALDLKGKVIWQKQAGGFIPEAYRYGYAPSPLLLDDRVVISSEFESAGFLASFAIGDGREIWRVNRPRQISYSSPIAANVAGREQILLSGAKHVWSFDPQTGKPLWSAPGLWEVTSGTMVWDGDLVFASGGFPGAGTLAVRADGSGQVLWKSKVKCYEQSLLACNGYLYAVDDVGVAHCLKADDGSEMWSQRLGGAISSSPVLAAGHIYVTNENGRTFVFKASPDQCQVVAQNQLGNEAFATPAIANSRIYHRVASRMSGTRKETLYCIGQSQE